MILGHAACGMSCPIFTIVTSLQPGIAFAVATPCS
jgi:hypothetical protein